jgi:hypothetical protein
VFHDHVSAALVVSEEVGNFDNVLVPNRVDRTGLIEESANDRLIQGGIVFETLDRHVSAKFDVNALKHFAHAALSERSRDTVSAGVAALKF